MMEVYEQGPAWVDVGDDVAFSHTTIILKQDDDFFHARTSRRYRSAAEINADELEVHPIPPSAIWPPLSPDLTQAPNPLPDNCYVKRPSLLYYSEMSADELLSDSLLQEARTCEILRAHPHPNIAQYFGCTTKNRRITGLCFARYNITLADQMKEGLDSFDRDICLRGIQDGIKHLHGLGLVHNDLNPYNIMLKSDATPVIIDFDSCRREGDKLGSTVGTMGWSDESMEFAIPANDYYGLKKIEEFMHSGKSKQNPDTMKM